MHEIDSEEPTVLISYIRHIFLDPRTFLWQNHYSSASRKFQCDLVLRSIKNLIFPDCLSTSRDCHVFIYSFNFNFSKIMLKNRKIVQMARNREISMQLDERNTQSSHAKR